MRSIILHSTTQQNAGPLSFSRALKLAKASRSDSFSKIGTTNETRLKLINDVLSIVCLDRN